MPDMNPAILVVAIATTLATFGPAHAAGGAHTEGQQAPGDQSLTPEQRMNKRFPQNVRVGDLVGLPVQDYGDRVLGYVTDVVRTADGKIVLVMPEGGWFGHGGRPVPIPIETVAILARHLNLLDIPRDDVGKLPTWNAVDSTPIGRDEIIRIAIGRR